MEAQTATVFSDRFEQIKARFKLRNRDLSRMAGVSDAAILKIVKGQTESPDVRTLVTLGKKLNLSADWLLFGEGPMVKDEVVTNTQEEYYKEKLKNSYRMIADLTELVGKSKGVSKKSRIAPREVSNHPSTNLMQKEMSAAAA